MPINLFKCQVCQATTRTMRSAPICCSNAMTKLIVPPTPKFMEPTTKETGKSVLKGMKDIVAKRAKEHSKNNEWDDIIQQEGHEYAARNGFLNENGLKKKKIDEI